MSAPKVALMQNYPNPFRGQTTFKYRVMETSPVNITIYDLSGKQVATAVNERKSAGTYEYNFDGTNLPTGIYVATLSTGYKTLQSIKISVVK